MRASASKASRAETVRRRRLQQNKRRYESVARASTSGVRPLVGQPRRSSASSSRGRSAAGQRRVLGLSLPARLALPRLAWPALPRTISWRVASLSMCLMLGLMLVRVMSDTNMYISGIALAGSALVPGDEIYESSGIAGQHIFWIDPVAVKHNVETVPGIANATVSVEWPNKVTIGVIERVPVVSWHENDNVWWVDADGNKFKARHDLPGLLPLHMDGPGGKSEDVALRRVPTAAIIGALQLRQLRPNIEMLYFDPLGGLSYPDGRGWRGYFGVGDDMPEKLAVYEALTENLTSRGIQPRIISVASALSPYYQR